MAYVPYVRGSSLGEAGLNMSDYAKSTSLPPSEMTSFVDVRVLDPALDSDGKLQINVAFALILLLSLAAWGAITTAALWLYWVVG